MVVYVGMNERKVGKDPLEDFYRGMEGLIEVLASEYPSTERALTDLRNTLWDLYQFLILRGLSQAYPAGDVLELIDLRLDGFTDPYPLFH